MCSSIDKNSKQTKIAEFNRKRFIKKHGGIKDWNQPIEGLGVTKAKNNQLVREYTLQDNSYLALEEAVMYKIDKNGKVQQLAIYDNDLKVWIRK